MRRPTTAALIFAFSLLTAGSAVGANASDAIFSPRADAPRATVSDETRPMQFAINHQCVAFGRTNRCRTRWDSHNRTCACRNR